MKDETVSKPTLKRSDTDILMDDETKETKPKLKRNRTHVISDDEDDDEPSPPPVKKLRSKTVSVTKVDSKSDYVIIMIAIQSYFDMNLHCQLSLIELSI